MQPAVNRDGDPGDLDWEADLVMLAQDDISDFNKDNILPQTPETLEQIRQWLNPTKYNDEGSEYRKHLETYLNGTCGWLRDTPAYLEWQESNDRGMLWLRGIPGSGKSVFAASMIRQLARDTPVLYFFFRQIIDANHDAITAVRDFLDQILECSPPLQLALKAYSDERQQRDKLTTGDMWRLLQLALSHIPKAYIIIDALDEMDQNKDAEHFYELLKDLAEWRPSQLKILITSRPVPSVERPLHLAKTFNIWLEEQIVDRDIAKYVEHSLAHSSIPPERYSSIKAAVPGRANGLFLYAKLAMDRFLTPNADIDEGLRVLPINLAVMYADLLHEHRRRSRISYDMQLLLLQWVTHANKPLRLLELAEVINITQFQEGARDLKIVKDLIRTACGPLLEILPDETVSVVHHSLTEYLNGSVPRGSQSYPVLEFGATHAQLALTCLSYMRSGTLSRMTTDSDNQQPGYPRDPRHGFDPWAPNEEVRINGPPPFMRYATSQWHVHARKATLAGIDQTQVNESIGICFTDQNLRTWAGLECLRERDKMKHLFMAASLGLTEYLKVILEHPDVDLDEHEKGQASPICEAASKGHDDAVQLLITSGRQVYWDIRLLRLPLYLAAEYDWPRIAEVLLAAGADPFSSAIGHNNDYRRTRPPRNRLPDEPACNQISLEVLELFLSAASENQAHQNTALHAAVRQRRSTAVKLVLDKCPTIEVNPKETGDSFLLEAAINHDPETMALLLQTGADPKSDRVNPVAHERPSTPLHLLFQDYPRGRRREDLPETARNRFHAFEACFKLLVNAGADINQVDGSGKTALHYAPNPSSAKVLLDAGADPKIADDNDRTILDMISTIEAIVRLVLETGRVEIDRPSLGNNNMPPLVFALHENRADYAILLLEYGAKADFIDDDGNGVFHHAAKSLGKAKSPRSLSSLCAQRVQIFDFGIIVVGHQFML